MGIDEGVDRLTVVELQQTTTRTAHHAKRPSCNIYDATG